MIRKILPHMSYEFCVNMIKNSVKLLLFYEKLQFDIGCMRKITCRHSSKLFISICGYGRDSLSGFYTKICCYHQLSLSSVMLMECFSALHTRAVCVKPQFYSNKEFLTAFYIF